MKKEDDSIFGVHSNNKISEMETELGKGSSCEWHNIYLIEKMNDQNWLSSNSENT